VELCIRPGAWPRPTDAPRIAVRPVITVITVMTAALAGYGFTIILVPGAGLAGAQDVRELAPEPVPDGPDV